LEIPPEITIRESIRPGSVYYFPHEKFVSQEPHFFVVINISPTTENVIFLAYPSSKIEIVKRRNKNNPPQTLVAVRQDQYPDFTCDSIFDCNKIQVDSIEKLVQRLSSGKLRLKAEMDIVLVEQLRRGVFASRLIPLNIKQQLGMITSP